MFRAIQDYDGTDTDKCISLVPGDKLSAVHTVDDVWFLGHNERTGETGAFPIACVEVVGNLYTPSPADKKDIPQLPEKPGYANVSKQIQERKARELQAAADDLDPEERSRSLSMHARAFDAARRRETKPEKTFTLKLVKANQDSTSGQEDPSGVTSPGVFRIPLPDERDSTIRSVHFDATKFQHSLSVPESELSWLESSFEQSYEPDSDVKMHPDVIIRDSSISLTSIGQKDEENRNMSKAETLKSTDNLFSRDEDENRVKKVVVSAIAGLLIVLFLFVCLVYSFGYTHLEAGIIVTFATVVMAICLALSSFCRSILVLVFPNFFTGKGRAVLLSIIFGILLSNQISNITHNAKETANSLACVMDIAANQTRAIQRELDQPIDDVTNYINAQQLTLQQLGQDIQDAFNSVNDTLTKADEGVESAKNAIGGIKEKCKDAITKGVNSCNSFCSGTVISSACLKTCGDIFKQLTACDPLDRFDFILTNATRDVRTSVNGAMTYFKVNLEASSTFSNSSNTSNASSNSSDAISDSSKASPAISSNVNAEMEAKAEAFQCFFTFCKKVLSFALALIFIQAFLYLQNYLSKDDYDNIYITRQFRELDRETGDQGREAIIPLKNRETGKYVNTSSWKLNDFEQTYCKIGLWQIIIHFLLFLLVELFDVTLYYILDLVRKYGDIELDVQNQGRFHVNVDGTGPVADFYKIMVQGINLDQTYVMHINIGNCLPNPSAPSIGVFSILMILYIFTLCFVLFRGYGMRMRRTISAYYFPEQESARLEYLHKSIHHERLSVLGFLPVKTQSSYKERAVRQTLSLCNWLVIRLPFLTKCFPSRDIAACTSCQQKESSLDGVQLSKCSGQKEGVACDALYCQSCQVALTNGCPICTNDQAHLRD